MIKDRLPLLESKRIRVLGYKQDHNTPCKHFYDGYPLEIVLEDGRYKGFSIAKVSQDTLNDGFYVIFNAVDGNLFVNTSIGCYGFDSIERIVQKFEPFAQYKGRDGFLRWLEFKVSHKWFVQNPELMALELLGETALAEKYLQHKKEFIERRELEEQQRRASIAALEAEREEKRKAEYEAKIAHAEEKIRMQTTLDNEDGIVLELMRRHNIKVPLRTQGWIIKSMAQMKWDNDGNVTYSYYKRKNSKGSQAVFKYLRQLEDAVNA